MDGAVASRVDVCLVSMPYPPLNQPSMALGLLTASLQRAGIAAAALYPCLWFAEAIGLDVYTFIADTKQELLVGEWTFATAAFGDAAPDDPAYIDAVLAAPVSQALLQKSRFRDDPHGALRRVRAAAPAFIEMTARRILQWQPKIVGCTSTFMQHVPSLAVLRRIKTLAPDVITMIGGANCEGAMGVATRRCFPWIDYVVSGEADLLLPDLCRHVLDRAQPGADLPYGVIAAGDPVLAGIGDAPRVAVDVMNDTPTPDFDSYFAALGASSLAHFIVPALAMETSRGCWWGKKHHCTFCGLNGGTMSFRSKPPRRVIDELDALSRRHGIRSFNVVDNILDLGYIDTVMPELAKDPRYTLFYETKANLRRDQLQRIAAAGIRRLQPGIESMHDEILRLIDKGTTALINLRLLKWARELGVFITWNFLWDVPGEQDSWYEDMAGWLPRVSHLQPPGIDRIQFHRFSPYHMRPAQYGLHLVPYPTYAAVYPLDPPDLHDLAYYHHDTQRRTAREEVGARPGLKQVLRGIALWNRAWDREEAARPVLVLRDWDDGGMVIEDTRPGYTAGLRRLSRVESRLLEGCEAIHVEASLVRDFSDDGAAAALDRLDRAGLVLRQGGKVMSLITLGLSHIPDAQADFPGGYVDLDAWHGAVQLA